MRECLYVRVCGAVALAATIQPRLDRATENAHLSSTTFPLICATWTRLNVS
jgi:hypothetical protein